MAKNKRKGKWSAEVTARSDALDLEPQVFTKPTAEGIAESLKRSAESSKRRKASPLQSAMSMLILYINRAGRNLSPERKRTLEAAKGKATGAFWPQTLAILRSGPDRSRQAARKALHLNASWELKSVRLRSVNGGETARTVGSNLTGTKHTGSI
jgi:hypothetical protein